jgi:phosphatidylglycerol---prolipoprotein diacylglyceryl transferase
MYPDLSYLFHDLFGTQVDNWTSIFKSFGLMLGVAFLACTWLVNRELRRYEAEGKIIPQVIANPEKKKADLFAILTNGVLAAFFLSKIPYIISNFEAFKGDPASIVFSIKGNWMIGIIAGLGYAGYLYYLESQKNIEALPDKVKVHAHQYTGDIIMIAAITGVVGARLFSILENLEDFFKDPIGQLFSGSGLTVYGGVILAFISVYWFIKKKGIKPVYMMDIAGMGILLGYGIGRIGCQIAGDSDWGIVAAPQPSWWFLPDWLWSYSYPNNVSNDGVTLPGCNADAIASATGYIEERCKTICGMRYCHQLDPKVYPTPIYETVASFIGFGILYLNRVKLNKIPGLVWFLYMIYNGIERFSIEQIRINEKYNLMGMNFSQAQYISLGFVLVGIIGVIYLLTSKDKTEVTS